MSFLISAIRIDLMSSFTEFSGRPALLTVNRSVWVRLEWNFAFGSAFAARCFVQGHIVLLKRLEQVISF